MTRFLTWLSLAALVAVYAIIVSIFPFEGPVALGLHFIRIAITVATLVLYLQEIPAIFAEVPPPRRDYLLAGINFMLLSATGFSFFNEVGRIFDVNTSVFTSTTAGLFSLMLIVGAAFVLAAPYPPNYGGKSRAVAIAVGIIASIGLVFVAPLFR